MQLRIGNKVLSFSLYRIAVHPLLTLTLAFMIGIGLQSLSLTLILLLLGLLLIGIVFDKWTFVVFHTLFVLLGIARYQSCIADKHSFDPYFEQKKCLLIGHVKNIEYSDHKNYSMIITLAVRSINDISVQSFFSDHYIKLFTTRTHKIRAGDSISLDCITIKKPHGPYEVYAWRDGIVGTAFIKKNSFTVVGRPAISISRYIIEKRNSLLDALKKRMSGRAFSFFSSLFLGNKQYYESELSTVKEQFKLWGLSHYLARSGLHLVLFVIIWEVLLKLLPVPWFFKHYILLFFVFIYLVLSWMSVSFLRAFITFIVYKVYTLLLIPVNALHALTLVTFFVLLLNPLHLFFLDFQLSFGLTFALIWFNAVTIARKQAI